LLVASPKELLPIVVMLWRGVAQQTCAMYMLMMIVVVKKSAKAKVKVCLDPFV